MLLSRKWLALWGLAIKCAINVRANTNATDVDFMDLLQPLDATEPPASPTAPWPSGADPRLIVSSDDEVSLLQVPVAGHRHTSKRALPRW